MATLIFRCTDAFQKVLFSYTYFGIAFCIQNLGNITSTLNFVLYGALFFRNNFGLLQKDCSLLWKGESTSRVCKRKLFNRGRFCNCKHVLLKPIHLFLSSGNTYHVQGHALSSVRRTMLSLVLMLGNMSFVLPFS